MKKGKEIFYKVKTNLFLTCDLNVCIGMLVSLVILFSVFHWMLFNFKQMCVYSTIFLMCCYWFFGGVDFKHLLPGIVKLTLNFSFDDKIKMWLKWMVAQWLYCVVVVCRQNRSALPISRKKSEVWFKGVEKYSTDGKQLVQCLWVTATPATQPAVVGEIQLNYCVLIT